MRRWLELESRGLRRATSFQPPAFESQSRHSRSTRFGRGRLLWVGRQRVDDFAGASIVEFLASFMLDGVGIILEAIDVLLEPVVFVLLLLDFVFELLLLVALAVPGG